MASENLHVPTIASALSRMQAVKNMIVAPEVLGEQHECPHLGRVRFLEPKLLEPALQDQAEGPVPEAPVSLEGASGEHCLCQGQQCICLGFLGSPCGRF